MCIYLKYANCCMGSRPNNTEKVSASEKFYISWKKTEEERLTIKNLIYDVKKKKALIKPLLSVKYGFFTPYLLVHSKFHFLTLIFTHFTGYFILIILSLFHTLLTVAWSCLGCLTREENTVGEYMTVVNMWMGMGPTEKLYLFHYESMVS